MGIKLHHTPVNKTLLWSMHVWQAAWDGDIVRDTKGTPNANMVDFELPDAADPRKLAFKFRSTDPGSGDDTWEPDDYARHLFLQAPAGAWTFEGSARVLYQDPFPAGAVFLTGEILTFQVITQNAFRGGRIYVWNPYDPSGSTEFFPESARDDSNGLSTFQVTLRPWMTSGFHLKLTKGQLWEPNAANRFWRPCDGRILWLKSGQCDVRSHALSLTAAPLEVLYSARVAAPPQLALTDVVETSVFPVSSSAIRPYEGNSLFNVATYNVSVYPEASYAIGSQNNIENPSLPRPFPANPSVPSAVSRFVLGAGGWLAAFPQIAAVPLAIQPQPSSSFGSGLSIDVSIGNGPTHETVQAAQQPDGTWRASLNVPLNTTSAIDLKPAAGAESKPYAWIDTSRYFTPTTAGAQWYTTEGVYGTCASGATQFAEPPAGRLALMEAAFGNAIASAGIFASREMPHGGTLCGGDVYFVVHAPHAVCARLILVDENTPGGPSRGEFPMRLTSDTFYWWCSLPVAQAGPGKRYRFLLNDNVEVIDPAARAVQHGASLDTSFGEDPANKATSWSVVLDVPSVWNTAHAQAWQTMGWQNLLIYEIHPERFSNLQVGAFSPLDLIADELQPVSRLNQPGYLHQLPVTTLGLMPVNEFSGPTSWGYDPSLYFAIDSFYGGAPALARLVNASHASGRGVTLDLVYNHSLDSPLMNIAPDVYRGGSYDGDLMNCGHPMVGEYFRQASVYLLRTFNLDGFRFDDTKTIVTQCQGGWEFLGMIRAALHAAASAEGRAWPYCVAENQATNPWDVSNPSWGVMDGQWDIDEVYRIRDASYDVWHDGSDDSLALKTEMDKPQYWGRPFFQATRFGESHDMVSEQDPGNKRIAARPQFGQGYQLAKALGTVTLLSNGIPMLFMGQEVGETTSFSLNNSENHWINPQQYDAAPGSASDNARILAWFRQLMGLRNDPSKGLQGDSNYQVTADGNRTVAFSCGAGQRIFVVVTFGTANQQQNSGWLGLPAGGAYKEIFNSSWPAFQVELEPEQTNGGYDARIYSGQTLNLPWMGATVLERI